MSQNWLVHATLRTTRRASGPAPVEGTRVEASVSSVSSVVAFRRSPVSFSSRARGSSAVALSGFGGTSRDPRYDRYFLA
jgi:hypothetical protein